MNIALRMSYDGTNYHGWQIQNNGASIQQETETALLRLFGEKVHVSGAGRTDAGVHAKKYVTNFHIGKCTIPLDRLPLALNSFLPPDIAVSAAAFVPDDFDARFDCTKKEYAYYIYNSVLRDPFNSRYAYRYHYPLEISLMRKAAKRFVGKQDFAAVRSQGTPVKNTVRTVFWCEIDQINELICIRVCGDGFLYNMVRAIAGTLIYCGSGKLSPDDVTAALVSKKRGNSGPTLPACGLFMKRLWYEHTPQLDPFRLHE